VEQAAVVDHARDQLHVVALGGGEHQLARPRLERVEDHHRPVDPLAEALEAVDQVEREAVGRPRGHADRSRQPGVAHGFERVPHRLARVADPVGVVEQQEVERARAAAFEAVLGRHSDIAGVGVRTAQPRVREAREALRPVALALVEVVPDRADQAVVLAREAGQSAAKQRVSLAGAVRVGGHHGPDAVAGSHERSQPLVIQRLTEAHEAPAAPRPDGDMPWLRHAEHSRMSAT
jgi:hypothetical protein